jgi:hypothetical protein
LIIDFDSTWNSCCCCCLSLPLGLTNNPQVRILVNQQVSQTEPNHILSPKLAILAHNAQSPCPALMAVLGSTKTFCQLPLGVLSWSGLVPPDTTHSFYTNVHENSIVCPIKAHNALSCFISSVIPTVLSPCIKGSGQPTTS